MESCLSLVAVAALTFPVFAANPTANEVESAAKQIVGAWKLKFTTPDGVNRTPLVLVGRQYQELVAWYVEQDQPESFKKVRLDDDTLSLTFRPKEREDVEVTFKARLAEENACVGEATYQSDFDETEKWQLSFVTPDEQRHEATVTVVAKNDQLYGWYSSNDFDLPAQKLAKDGDKVVMSMKVKTRDGANVDVTFRGTVDADRVNGEADYDLEGDTGSFPFTGQRKS